MQRVVGYLLMLSGCTGLGLWYSMQFRLRIHSLKQMNFILELLEGQVRFGRSTLPECCIQIAERVEEPFKGSFQEIYERNCRNRGDGFGQVCKEVFEQKLKKLVVSETEKEQFITCFASCGYEDDKMQIRSIQQGRQELERIITELNGTLNSRCRLAVSLGTMSGLLLVILFL